MDLTLIRSLFELLYLGQHVFLFSMLRLEEIPWAIGNCNARRVACFFPLYWQFLQMPMSEWLRLRYSGYLLYNIGQSGD